MDIKINNTVLVADDEPDTCNFIKKILERRGFKVDVALDGVKAKEFLETKQFNKIFLDCSMPGLSGLELIKVARDKNPNAKIIIFSGYQAVDGKVADDLGADEFLQKPLSVEKIEEILGI